MKDYKKKYEDVLNAARKFKNNCPSLWDTESNPFRGVFEELKESEDEKIKEDLIQWINEFPDVIWRGHNTKDVIAWLERARQVHTTNVDENKKSTEYIFPELKESEDERIRKEIISYIKSSGAVTNPNWIAWLEKQGLQKQRKEWDADDLWNYNQIMHILQDCNQTELMDWLEKQGNLIESYEDKLDRCASENFDKGYKVALEKQGEQKQTLPKWKYKKDNTPLLRDSIILNKYGCVAKSPSGALVSDVWTLDYDELKKLPKEEFEKQCEQKSEELPNGEDYGIDSLYHAARILEKTLGEVDGYQSDDGILEHKCAIEAVNRLYKQQPAWSEEDEEIAKGLNNCIDELEETHGWCFAYVDGKDIRLSKIRNWLKSLKERMKGEL